MVLQAVAGAKAAAVVAKVLTAAKAAGAASGPIFNVPGYIGIKPVLGLGGLF